MGVILVDLADDQHNVSINWWSWRPILAFLRAAELIDEKQFERMGANGCGGELTREDALKVAAYLKKEILSRMKDGERMHVDGQISAVPFEPRPISSTGAHELYAINKSCIESFVTFCEWSGGFRAF